MVDTPEDVVAKYRERLSNELDLEKKEPSKEKIRTREYTEFKESYLPAHFSRYERWCNLSEKILRIGPDKKKAEALQKSIEVCHLNTTTIGVTSFAFLAPLLVAVIGSVLGLLLFQTTYFVGFSVMIAIMMVIPLQKLPHFLANSWRMRASNQMVLCIFYVVTYMRHTSNLELAIEFAAEHLSPPLSLDLKKVLWDVETERFESVKESLENYLESWRQYNMEFVESFHLITASLYESSEDRRLSSLDKSLTVILDETYEKMIHYAHDLKGPITMLHMIGVILPILGLVILPLVVSFMEGVTWFHISSLYNIFLPLGVLYMGINILASRPSGYGDSDISETNPQIKKYENLILNLGAFEIKISPVYESIIIGFVCLLIGFSPIIIHALFPGFDIPILNSPMLHYIERDSKIIGPFGLGASILSLAVPLGFGLAVGMYFKIKAGKIMEIRTRAKKLEEEFASALFQLGNRLGDGFPAEIAFGKVAESMKGTVSGKFFEHVSQNITSLGMGVEQAIFNPKNGALVFYPSNMIVSSMKVLVESSKKGPQIASQALMNVSKYIQEMHRVNERLKDLMADVVSSMKSQISFMTPAISGIVIGITSMVSLILIKLGEQMTTLTSGQGAGMAGGMGIMQMFQVSIPTYYFQIIVGIYVVQIIYILTIFTNVIENGSDKLNERYMLGQNMIKGPILYIIISGAMMATFNSIALSVLKGSLGG